MSGGMEGLRDLLAAEFQKVAHAAIIGHPLKMVRVHEHADALLAPDGPLFPALELAGNLAHLFGVGPREWLANNGITGPLADACLAAAEVAP